MKKKLLSVLLVTVMSVSLLVGCGGNSDANVNGGNDTVIENQDKETESEEESQSESEENQLGTSITIEGDIFKKYNVVFTYDDSIVKLEPLFNNDRLSMESETSKGSAILSQQEQATAEEYYNYYKVVLESEMGVDEYGTSESTTRENLKVTECIPVESEYGLSISYFEYQFDVFGYMLDEKEDSGELEYFDQDVYYRVYIVESTDGLLYTVEIGSHAYGNNYTEEDFINQTTNVEDMLKAIIDIEKEDK